MKLKDIAIIRTGLVLSRKKATSIDIIHKVYKQITLKSFTNNIFLKNDSFDEFHSREEINEDYISNTGDVIVRLREPNIAICIKEHEEGMIIPSFMSIIRPNKNIICSEYLAFYLNSTIVKRILKKEIKGTTIPMIKSNDLSQLDITLPSLQEQKEIVEYLKLAQQECNLLEKLKEQKENYAKCVFNTIINNKNKGQ